ncbi:MAG: transposase [Prolixibacteraceae bacterium]|nr:transposase [Prolixibacteraceae bacterium]
MPNYSKYLSRYVFRVAITDRRIVDVKDGKVLFTWKDYRTARFHRMKLDIDEFIRRFLLHVLPKGFFKVRYYGIFSSRYRKKKQVLDKKAGRKPAKKKKGKH